ncbi:MAG: cobalt-precorrin-4/precorrin-4 C(11)-methyltransferase, partial [Oscillospiraceae bacterium]|nr:cobalt-precorrin-4/precorrin-4 C(11)-methyltransferase [Oscillospiraceae bacterium]
MVHFVGAGPGAPDLITLRGAALLEAADVIIYAGSLVNPALLERKKPGCAVYNSAKMHLDEVIAVMAQAEAEGKTTVRLHTGDASLYGAIREQMDELDARGIAYDVTPGVSSFCGAAASLCAEY